MNDLDRMALTPDAGGDGSGDNSRLARIVWRGKWFVLVCTLLGTALGYEYLSGKTPWWQGLTPRYRATARMIVSNREIDPMKGEASAGVKQVNLLNQQRALVKSEAILRPLSQNPILADLKHFRKSGKPLISVLSDGLFASIDAKSDLLLIHFESAFKREAVAVVDAAIETFLEYHRSKKLADTRQLIGLLREELDARVEELGRLATEVFEIKRSNLALFGGTGEKNLVTDRLSAASTALTQASQKVVQAKARYEAMAEAKAESAQRFLEYGEFYRNASPSQVLEERLKPITEELVQLEKDYARLRPTLTDAHQEIVKIRDRMAALTQREQGIILDYAQTYLRSTNIALREAEREEEHWGAAYLALEGVVLKTETAANELRLLQAKRDIVQSELDQLLARIGELNLAQGTGALNLDVMEKARPGSAPVYPDELQIIGLGAALGFALGLLIVLARGLGDRRILTIEEVPELLGLSVLAAFPRLSKTKRARVGRVVEQEQGSLAAEAVRSVRSAVSFGLPHNGRGLVLVTSSTAGEGKSVLASNLALALGQAGRRTVLVDADLRSPQQHEIFDIALAPGVGDVLSGARSCGEAIVRALAKNVDVLPGGDAPGHAAALLEGENMGELLNWLRRQYDCVVIDSSPVLETSECRILASQVDVAILVLRLHLSRAPDAQRARDLLAGVCARILGVWVNGDKAKRGARSYAGGISYGAQPDPRGNVGRVA